ncbi:MAG: hypothetical protein JO370_02150 [Paucibacter sp.]|nr:hypothetical protein [Roseateles sp.]
MSAFQRASSLGLIFAAALNGTMVMPLVVLALTRVPGIDEASATAIAAAELAGIACYCLLLPGSALRSRRFTAWFGIIALSLGELASQHLSSSVTLSLARLVVGLGEGALFSLICANVAGEAQAERIWGQVNLVGGVTMGLLLYGLSTLPASTGRGPIFLWLALLGALVAPAALTLRPRAEAATWQPAVPLQRLHKHAMWFVVALAYAVQAGQWAVCGYLGEIARLPIERVGEYLALSSILGFAGAIAPSFAQRASQRLGFVLLGFLIMALSVAVFFNWLGDLPFFLGQIGVNVGFYMLTPFVVGTLTENDADGRLVMRTLVIALSGSAVGTALAGAAFTQAGRGTFSALCVALIAICAFAAARVLPRIEGAPRATTAPAATAPGP